MIDSPDEMAIIVALFFVVFVLNVLPAFAPPTWMTLSFVGLAVHNVNVITLAVVGATAATLGRIALAQAIAENRSSRIAERTGPAQHRRNQARDRGSEGADLYCVYGVRVESIAIQLSIHRLWTYLPANHVPSVPFFVGRLLSYGFWVATASTVGARLNVDWFGRVAEGNLTPPPSQIRT